MTEHQPALVKTYIVSDAELLNPWGSVERYDGSINAFHEMVNGAGTVDVSIFMVLPGKRLAECQADIMQVLAGYAASCLESDQYWPFVMVRWSTYFSPLDKVDLELSVEGYLDRHVNVYLYAAEYFAMAPEPLQELLNDMMRLNISGVEALDKSDISLTALLGQGLTHRDDRHDRLARDADFNRIVLYERTGETASSTEYHVGEPVEVATNGNDELNQ